MPITNPISVDQIDGISKLAVAYGLGTVLSVACFVVLVALIKILVTTHAQERKDAKEREIADRKECREREERLATIVNNSILQMTQALGELNVKSIERHGETRELIKGLEGK